MIGITPYKDKDLFFQQIYHKYHKGKENYETHRGAGKSRRKI